MYRSSMYRVADPSSMTTATAAQDVEVIDLVGRILAEAIRRGVDRVEDQRRPHRNTPQFRMRYVSA